MWSRVHGTGKMFAHAKSIENYILINGPLRAFVSYDIDSYVKAFKSYTNRELDYKEIGENLYELSFKHLLKEN